MLKTRNEILEEIYNAVLVLAIQAEMDYAFWCKKELEPLDQDSLKNVRTNKMQKKTMFENRNKMLRIIKEKIKEGANQDDIGKEEILRG